MLPPSFATPLQWSFVAVAPMFGHARSLIRSGILSGLRERPVLRFLLTWIAVPLIILSVARSRLPLYVLPLFPALALITARSLIAAWPARRVSRVALVVGIASLVLVVGGKAVLAYMPSAKDERRLYQSLRVHVGSTGWTVNCTNRELYGVTFYLGGRAERVDGRHGAGDRRQNSQRCGMANTPECSPVRSSRGRVPANPACAGRPGRRMCGDAAPRFSSVPREADSYEPSRIDSQAIFM